MAHRVRAVRFCLLMFAALAGMLYLPEMAFAIVPVAFFPGQAGCFCCASNPCPGVCSSFPQSLTITFSGFVDGNCSICENYDGTYVVDGFETGCSRRYVFTGVCEDSGGLPNHFSEVLWTFYTSGSTTRLQVDLILTCTSSVFEVHRFDVQVANSAPGNCVLSTSTNVPYSTTIDCNFGFARRCDGSGVTCTAAP